MRRMLLTAALILLASVAWAQNHFEDVSLYPIEADPTSDGNQYSTAVTTTTADTDVDVWAWEFDPSFNRTIWPRLTYRTIAWCYIYWKMEFKAASSATADLIWRLEARNDDGTYINLVEDFTIASTNDVLVLTSSEGGPQNIDVAADGTYGGSALADSLAAEMNANSTLTGSGAITFTVTWNNTAQVFVVSAGSGNTIALTFAGSDAATTFGWDANQAAAATITSSWKVPATYETNIGATYVERVREGYCRITSDRFDRVPADFRIAMQCSEANEGVGRVHNDTAIRIVYKRTQ